MDMNTFLKRSIKEYRQQIDLKTEFTRRNKQLAALFDQPGLLERRDLPAELRDRKFVFLLLIAPLTEVAWANGRVTNREMDAIMQVADAYRIIEDESAFCELMGSLLTRPSLKSVARVWKNLQTLMSSMTDEECEILNSTLLLQTQFVALQSSNNLMSLLRGERICRDEEIVLQRFAAELKKARPERREEKADLSTKQAAAMTAAPVKKAIVTKQSVKMGITYPPKPRQKQQKISSSLYPVKVSGESSVAKEMDALLPLVPLVKVAWAEGRVTKKERQVIFEAAAKMGIVPGTFSYTRLNDWLELDPTEDFYDQSFANLRKNWAGLNPEEKNRRHFELLDRCTMVAEASGGSEKFAAGGARISDEEITAVKHIAKKLNQRAELS
jgi:hypothetical protein